MQERVGSSNDVLIDYVPRAVQEAFSLQQVTAYAVTKEGHDAVIGGIFKGKPFDDADKLGWLSLLHSSYLGYAIQQNLIGEKEVLEGDFINKLQSQLKSDAPRWGDTWKKRSIDGQLDRTYQSIRDYHDKYVNGNEQFPWLKVAGGIIINLYRLDNPDYQK